MARLTLSSLLLLGALTAPASARSIPHGLAKRDARQDGLPSSTIQLVKSVLASTANESWEIGTHLEAMTEYDYPKFAPFSSSYMPPPSDPTPSNVMQLAASVVRNKSADALQLMPDGSAADPASCGPAISMSNATLPEGQSIDGVTSDMMATAATGQMTYLLTQVPKTQDGALSHRNDELQLWSDFVYMVPPFLAYYGVMTKNESLIQASYDQIRLYRQYLRQPNGLWAHIVLGSMTDPGLWATGNGWASAGMMRVYGTIENSDFKSQFSSQLKDLGDWASEIVEAAFPLLGSNGLFHNYLNETRTFSDAASTALLTSVSYRLAQMSISSKTVSQADQTRVRLYSHINNQGILNPVVNPLSYGEQGTISPEGQGFVLLMEAAWRDWKDGGGKADSTGSSNLASSSTTRLAWSVSAAMISVTAALLVL